MVLVLSMILLCATLALFPLLVRIGLIVGLLLACVIYVWLAVATAMALAVWLVSKAGQRR